MNLPNLDLGIVFKVDEHVTQAIISKSHLCYSRDIATSIAIEGLREAVLVGKLGHLVLGDIASTGGGSGLVEGDVDHTPGSGGGTGEEGQEGEEGSEHLCAWAWELGREQKIAAASLYRPERAPPAHATPTHKQCEFSVVPNNE